MRFSTCTSHLTMCTYVGMEIVREIENLATGPQDRPQEPVKIAQCGEFDDKHPPAFQGVGKGEEMEVQEEGKTA